MTLSFPATARFRALTVRLLAVTAAACVSIPGYAADGKQTPKIAPGLPASSGPSGAEAVGKLLNPTPADPSVPLPTPNLAEREGAQPSSQGAQIYGRAERGGQNNSVLEGLVGVRIPFSSAPRAPDTTYGSGN
ncbi:MAG: hypothetical protein JSR24_15910 [Proteobacteria bacterium]|nr:hypothetical protein [Pseudomonadota bacterium]